MTCWQCVELEEKRVSESRYDQLPLFRGLMAIFNMQGGVTEEQMLKHLGANTNLTPKEAVKLLEVCITFMASVYKYIAFHVLVVTLIFVARITELWSPYLSLRT